MCVLSRKKKEKKKVEHYVNVNQIREKMLCLVVTLLHALALWWWRPRWCLADILHHRWWRRPSVCAVCQWWLTVLLMRIERLCWVLSHFLCWTHDSCIVPPIKTTPQELSIEAIVVPKSWDCTAVLNCLVVVLQITGVVHNKCVRKWVYRYFGLETHSLTRNRNNAKLTR